MCQGVSVTLVCVCVPCPPPGLAGQLRLNGVLDGQPVVKRRRGRRKNVEGMDLLFLNRSRAPVPPEQRVRTLSHTKHLLTHPCSLPFSPLCP